MNKLTFDDEFNSLSLYNGTSGVWQPAMNYSPNGTTDTGSMTSWEVNPLWGPTSAADANVYSIGNGVLSMAIKPTPADVNPASVNNQPFLAGELTTYPSFSQTYGYFEMNADLAAGPGFMSAFWLLPTSGAWPPELDAEEVLGNTPSTLIMTTHTSNGAGGDNAFPQWTNIPDSTQGFHTYAVDWEANTITWYFDGQQVAQAPTPADMHSPMYMLIDDMSGASGSWTGSPTSPTQSSAMKINFIHVYDSNPYVNGVNTVLGGSATNPVTGGSTTPPVTNPPVTTPPVTTPNQPVLITPGTGSFKDTTGNVYTIAANGDADENGKLMNGGTGTGALELANGVIYGQDASSKTWYTWNQTTWTQASSAPPAVSVTTPPVTTPPVTTPPVTTPPVTSPPVTTPNPVLITPGVGSFKDTTGNVYTVTANGDADENGNLMNGGTGTGALELANGVIYGQDAASKTWYTWNQTTWTQATSAPPAVSVSTGGGTTTPPVVTNPAPVTTGTGSDTLVLSISEDAYQGNAQFTVSVDGKQLAGTFTTTASHAAGASQSFTFNGDWAPGAHAVAVNFLNDTNGGTAATHRNLYVNGISYDGKATGQTAAPMAGGPKGFSVTDSTAVPSPAIGSGSDTMTLNVSEDAYQGNAQFTVSVDGKQLGGTFTATALHSAAASQNFMFQGDFGTGQHAVAVNFLNDAYGGSATNDRNLYVNSIAYNGTATGQSAVLGITGPQVFTVSGGTTSSVSETGDHGSLAKSLSQTGSYTVGGDTFVLTAGNAASVTLGTGTSQIKFIGASSITLTGGSGQATVTADTGTNKFVAGTGTLDVTGGGGKDAYVFHANGGLLKLEDVSIAKGDTLTVDKTLQGAMQQTSDGQGGTMIAFGVGATHGVDIHGLATMPTTSVLWA